ncbi:diaminobutyrate acetyltransferase [Ammoniphilus sp. CFH 90114]|uniref:diaminobutyrate acetyltransferase n=1 Tax=Ammoniphilus sp. CFH 90114 TaxID=2493665 RepID=UPI00100F9060|nr:diaminobutyrate acetyltransferase [Ammoniphilus sp. CFH 90114]RXT04921.1 diaminobutyrate acetyltransferase [Ammoniphilus sp. CFH 90114]
MSSHLTTTFFHFRKPRKEDAAEIWKLIKGTRVLDLNSAYCYLMLCEWFPDTCVIAEEDQQIVGFVSAFRPPNKPDVIFVWQVAVQESMRGKGLGKKLLQELLERDECENIHYLEATVSPSNLASQSLFQSLAQQLNCSCCVQECFSVDMFPEPGHEAEQIYRIGPIVR